MREPWNEPHETCSRNITDNDAMPTRRAGKNNTPEKVSGKRSIHLRGNSENWISTSIIEGRGSAHAYAHECAHPVPRSEITSTSNKPPTSTRDNKSTDLDSDDSTKKWKRAEGKHEGAIEDATSDTDDYDNSTSEDSPSETISTNKSRRKGNTSKACNRNSNSEFNEGMWLNTTSDSDDKLIR